MRTNPVSRRARPFLSHLDVPLASLRASIEAELAVKGSIAERLPRELMQPLASGFFVSRGFRVTIKRATRSCGRRPCAPQAGAGAAFFRPRPSFSLFLRRCQRDGRPRAGAIGLEDEQAPFPVPLLPLIARSHPVGGTDVRQISAVAQCPRFFGGAGRAALHRANAETGKSANGPNPDAPSL